MGSRLSTFSFAHLLGISFGDHKPRPKSPIQSKKSPSPEGNASASDIRRSSAAQVDLAAISQATAAAVAAERVRWGEIMSVGMSFEMSAYAIHLAKSGMSADDAIFKLKQAKADIEKTAPSQPDVQDGWAAEKARQATEGRPTPMQIREERIRQFVAKGNEKWKK